MNAYEKLIISYRDERNKERPLFSIKVNPSNFSKHIHSHMGGQFCFSDKEMLKVVANNIYWYIFKDQILWIPPKVEHEAFSTKKHSCISIHLDPSRCRRFSKKPCVLALSPLVKELIKRSSEFDIRYKVNSPEYRLVKVLIKELSLLPETKLYLPMGTDERVKRLIEILIQNPRIKYTIYDMAKVAFVSERNLNRLFEMDTGITVGEWRIRQKILFAMEMLEQGEPVTVVAIKVGYDSLSAFIGMFRKITGKTPRHFLNKRQTKYT